MSSIAELLHMNKNALRKYSKVWTAVKQILSEHVESKVQSREAMLADSIKASVRILESSRDLVNYQTISELTGLSVGFLKRRDLLREIIEEASTHGNTLFSSVTDHVNR
jgi:hypothetical protein